MAMLNHALTVNLSEPVKTSVLPITDTRTMPAIIVVRKPPVSRPARSTIGRGRVKNRATTARSTGYTAAKRARA